MKVVLLLRLTALWALSWILTGCAALLPLAPLLTGGSINSSLAVQTQTQVKLEEGNFITVRTNVVGISKGFKFLGFITLRPATVDEAMNRLYANAEIQEGRPQTPVHLIVEQSGMYLILFSIPTVTVRADLIEFLPSRIDEEDNGSKSLEVRPIRHEKKSPIFQ